MSEEKKILVVGSGNEQADLMHRLLHAPDAGAEVIIADSLSERSLQREALQEYIDKTKDVFIDSCVEEVKLLVKSAEVTDKFVKALIYGEEKFLTIEDELIADGIDPYEKKNADLLLKVLQEGSPYLADKHPINKRKMRNKIKKKMGKKKG